MAKEIKGPIRLGGAVYRKGDEEALQQAATSSQIEEWQAAGMIAGEWEGLPNFEGVDRVALLIGPGRPVLSEAEGATFEAASHEEAAGFLSMSCGIERGSEETPTEFLARVAAERTSAQEQLQVLRAKIPEIKDAAALALSQKSEAQRERDEAVKKAEELEVKNKESQERQQTLELQTKAAQEATDAGLEAVNAALEQMQQAERERDTLKAEVSSLHAQVEATREEAKPTKKVPAPKGE